MSHALFCICIALASSMIAAECYLIAYGVGAWPPLAMAGFWLLLAWFHARRVPSKK